jgi:hypothetical protein
MSGQERQATHFFDLPILASAPLAWEKMLMRYPSLAQAARMPADQAAFVAGYLCHLQADWMWITDIFAPVFGPWSHWQDFRQRLYLHNVLRAYLDRQILEGLPEHTGSDLGRALPKAWLPFVEDRHLYHWRDFLADQLLPGATVQTVEVFAARQGVPAETYYLLLNSEERMEQEIFIHLPRQSLLSYRQRLLVANGHLLQAYLLGV